MKNNQQFLTLLMGTMVLSLLFVINLTGGETMPSFTPEIKTLAVFKNGLGFVMREGDASLKDGWTQTRVVPSASLGAIWITVFDKSAVLDSAVGFKEEVKTKVEALDFVQLLKVNTGKKVVLYYGDRRVDGVIKSVPGTVAARPAAPAPRPEDSWYLSSSAMVRPQPADNPAIIILSTSAGHTVSPLNGITKIEFPDSYTDMIESTGLVNKIKIKVDTEKERVKLGVTNLEKGVSWIPDYAINIMDPQMAKITMNATLINDAEDIEDAEVHFVVGFPNFMFADIKSPMSMEESLMQFIQSLSSSRQPQRNYDQFSNIMVQAAIPERREPGSPGTYSAEDLQRLGSESEEDLFFYDRKKVTLRKGERAYYQIFSDMVNYSHVYEWNIPELTGIDAHGYSRGSGTTQPPNEQVWHSLKLTNTTDYPWTTAPAFALNDWKPLAQDKLSYTPKGARTNLKLTIANDIRVDRNESEVSRVQVEVMDDDFDLITIRGEINIRSYKGQDVVMEISKDIIGEVISASNNGKAKKTVEALAAVNSHSNIAWELPVKAGEALTLTYKYKIYKQR